MSIKSKYMNLFLNNKGVNEATISVKQKITQIDIAFTIIGIFYECTGNFIMNGCRSPIPCFYPSVLWLCSLTGWNEL